MFAGVRNCQLLSPRLGCVSVLQGEAIAYNLREMFGLRVPVISVVIGEGGSGGALAIGCANRNLIMENSVYYVASPEACAAILWKSRSASSQVRAPVSTARSMQGLRLVSPLPSSIARKYCS